MPTPFAPFAFKPLPEQGFFAVTQATYKTAIEIMRCRFG
jgi:hypothetical protein